MNFKSVSPWWALCLVALSGAAHADLEPFSFGANESLQHQSNINRSQDAHLADWISITEFDAALDQAIGRQRLTASGTFDVNRYKKEHNLDANGYSAAGTLNWETVGDLTGSIGADSRRRQYFYGLNGELQSPGSSTGGLGRNLETDNHVFANAQLGGIARWTLFAGGDASERKYSNPTFAANEERQWSGNAGTRYSTSPDLSFGITGNVTHGLYPKFEIDGEHDDFDVKSIDLTTKWQATGVSELDAAVGYSDAHYTGQAPSKFVNGSLNWTWTPPSHFTVVFGLSRDTNADTQASANAGPNANDLTGRSINNVAHLSVGYALTAKTTVSMTAQYTERRYSNAVIPLTATSTTSIDGSNRTTQVGLSAQFLPTRTTSLGCSVSREQLKPDAAIALITPAYSDNIFMCTAAIRFD